MGLICLSITLTGCGSSEETSSVKSQTFGIYVSTGSQHSNESLELKENGKFILQGCESDDTGKGTYTILNNGVEFMFNCKDSFGGKFENEKTLTCSGSLTNNTVTINLPDSEIRTFFKQN